MHCVGFRTDPPGTVIVEVGGLVHERSNVAAEVGDVIDEGKDLMQAVADMIEGAGGFPRRVEGPTDQAGHVTVEVGGPIDAVRNVIDRIAPERPGPDTGEIHPLRVPRPMLGTIRLPRGALIRRAALHGRPLP